MADLDSNDTNEREGAVREKEQGPDTARPSITTVNDRRLKAGGLGREP
jgi:hypothetical protein